MILSVSCPILPAASWATTVMILTPDVSVTLDIDHAVVPVAVPDPPVSHDHVTEDTPTASDAVPDIVVIGVVEVAYVESEVGLVMVQTGGVTSPDGGGV